ncbi:MAG: sigma-70 family RNA polymerase sigma factor [Cryomorphaceae bacterium]|nr:sigma-70 family RNA polymerase sigma factor [Cryomorphaceae bacterium]
MHRFSNESNVENKEQLKEIIEGCLRNDRRSQEAIFKLFYGKMMVVCMRYTNDPILTDNDNDFKIGGENPMEEKETIELGEIKAEMAMEAIQKLSPAYRTVFNLYVLEEYSHKEIAEMLGISEGTSKSNLAKAKMNLQKILNQQFMNID